MTLDEAIQHAREVAEDKRADDPNDFELDNLFKD